MGDDGYAGWTSAYVGYENGVGALPAARSLQGHRTAGLRTGGLGAGADTDAGTAATPLNGADDGPPMHVLIGRTRTTYRRVWKRSA